MGAAPAASFLRLDPKRPASRLVVRSEIEPPGKFDIRQDRKCRQCREPVRTHSQDADLAGRCCRELNRSARGLGLWIVRWQEELLERLRRECQRIRADLCPRVAEDRYFNSDGPRSEARQRHARRERARVVKRKRIRGRFTRFKRHHCVPVKRWETENSEPAHISVVQQLSGPQQRRRGYATESDVTREANDGRGPLDFKVSRGSKDKTLVEFKLAKNSQLEKNLKHQAEIYQKASDADRAIKVIIYFTAREKKRLEGILKKLKLDGHKDVVLIDARKDNKPSGSKAGS